MPGTVKARIKRREIRQLVACSVISLKYTSVIILYYSPVRCKYVRNVLAKVPCIDKFGAA